MSEGTVNVNDLRRQVDSAIKFHQSEINKLERVRKAIEPLTIGANGSEPRTRKTGLRDAIVAWLATESESDTKFEFTQAMAMTKVPGWNMTSYNGALDALHKMGVIKDTGKLTANPVTNPGATRAKKQTIWVTVNK